MIILVTAGKPRRTFSLLVFVIPGCLILLYATVTSVDVLRLRPATDDPSAAVFNRSSVNGSSSTAVHRSTAPPRCPGPADTDDRMNRRACEPVLRGKNGWSLRPRRAVITAAEYLERAKNCDCFRSDLGYFVSPEDTTDDERRFPIAFSLLTYENLEQTERLLRLIYRPHNVYCIHVDATSPDEELRNGMEAIANCFHNVFVAKPPIDVRWGKVSIIHAEMLCMRRLLDYGGWKYFINLVGRDFPLRTNYELVRILSAYNGSNDVDGSRLFSNHYFPDWYQYSCINHDTRGERKGPVPHGFNVAKGSTHMAVTRGFVEFALYDSRAQDLLHYMRDIKVPDEHFFQTLNHNPQMDIPGSFKGDPDSKRSFVRAKHWSFYPGQKCYGMWIRWVCNVGVGDMPWVIASPHMFVNKIRIEQAPAAFRCLELWYRDRVRRRRPLANENDTFDVSIYASQPFVRDHL